MGGKKAAMEAKKESVKEINASLEKSSRRPKRNTDWTAARQTGATVRAAWKRMAVPRQVTRQQQIRRKSMRGKIENDLINNSPDERTGSW